MFCSSCLIELPKNRIKEFFMTSAEDNDKRESSIIRYFLDVMCFVLSITCLTIEARIWWACTCKQWSFPSYPCFLCPVYKIENYCISESSLKWKLETSEIIFCIWFFCIYVFYDILIVLLLMQNVSLNWHCLFHAINFLCLSRILMILRKHK